MKLVPNWQRVLRHAWSVHLVALSILFQVADVALPYFQPWFPEGIFTWLSAIAAIGAVIARILPQKKVSNGQDE